MQETQFGSVQGNTTPPRPRCAESWPECSTGRGSKGGNKAWFLD